MISTFILREAMPVPRRTIHISDRTEARVRELAADGESFSAAVSRLVEAGADALGGNRLPRFVGIADGPREELGRRAEEVLDQLSREWRG
jgi:hypothetical protein